MAKRLHVELALEENNVADYPYFEKVRSAKITLGGETIGVIGEIKGRVLRNFKIKSATAIELNLDKLVKAERKTTVSMKLSKFPFVERDLTAKVAAEKEFAEYEKGTVSVFEGEEDFVYSVSPVSIYQGDDKASKNLSFHLSFASTVKTLEANDISDIMKKVEQKITELGAEVV